MNIWFCADCHFGHDNIRKYCERPFKTLEEMDSVLIRNWNQRVKKEDTVFHVGDFCFKNSLGGKPGEGQIHRATYYREKLNGDIIFIKGNHDENNSLKTPIEHIVIKHGARQIKLVHNPLHADCKYELNFVGHVHQHWQVRALGEKSLMVNVGVDVWKFMPVSYDEIMKAIGIWKKSNLK